MKKEDCVPRVKTEKQICVDRHKMDLKTDASTVREYKETRGVRCEGGCHESMSHEEAL